MTRDKADVYGCWCYLVVVHPAWNGQLLDGIRHQRIRILLRTQVSYMACDLMVAIGVTDSNAICEQPEGYSRSCWWSER
jgi:hypothetical protein